MRKIGLLRVNSCLKMLQSPDEVGDYHQPSLIEWRAQIRRLDVIAEEYLKTLYPKKNHG